MGVDEVVTVDKVREMGGGDVRVSCGGASEVSRALGTTARERERDEGSMGYWGRGTTAGVPQG